MKAIYYPNLSKLTFYDENDIPVRGFIGNNAHLKAAALMVAGEIVTINISNKPSKN